MRRDRSERSAGLQACGEENSCADGRMRDDFNSVFFRDPPDAHEVRNSFMPHFRLNDCDRAMRCSVNHIVVRSPFLSHRYGDFRSAANGLQSCDVLRPDGSFRKPRAAFRHCAQEFQCFVGTALPVHIHGDPSFRTQDTAQCLKLRDHAVFRYRRGKFEVVESRRLPFNCKRRALLNRRFRQAGKISRDFIAFRSAEKLLHRLTRNFSDDVPQRDVDRRQSVDIETAGISAHAH